MYQEPRQSCPTSSPAPTFSQIRELLVQSCNTSDSLWIVLHTSVIHLKHSSLHTHTLSHLHLHSLCHTNRHIHIIGRQSLKLLCTVLVGGGNRCPIPHNTRVLWFVLWKLIESMGPKLRLSKFVCFDFECQRRYMYTCAPPLHKHNVHKCTNRHHIHTQKHTHNRVQPDMVESRKMNNWASKNNSRGDSTLISTTIV